MQLGKGAKHEKRTEAAAAAIEARLTTAKLHNFKTRCEVAEHITELLAAWAFPPQAEGRGRPKEYYNVPRFISMWRSDEKLIMDEMFAGTERGESVCPRTKNFDVVLSFSYYALRVMHSVFLHYNDDFVIF